MSLRYIIAMFFLLCLTACAKKHAPIISFYYWQQSNDFDTNTEDWMKKTAAQKYYVHVMDVVWNETAQIPMPTTKTAVNSSNPITSKELVPVVFIHEGVFRKINKDSISSLARAIIKTSKQFMQLSKPSNARLAELQIDCDWTKSTTSKYFALLEEIKRQAPDILLGATIRLYPYRYPKAMGVPPVDYGVLMCYNLENIKEASTKNSILDIDVLKKYKLGSPYALPLKPALPMFGWYAWFRNGKFKNIIYAAQGMSGNKDLIGDAEQVIKDTVLAGQYIRKGDRLRNEFPSVETIQEAKNIILNKMPETTEIIYYYWNQTNLPYYEKSIEAP